MVITPKQTEIVQLIADGKTNIQIAKILYNSPETIKSHIKKILEFNGLNSRAQIVAVAMREGIIQ